jgi:acyl dehydratase
MSSELVTPGVEVTADLVHELIELGGYTHPLFQADRAEQGPPLPGQAVLLLMGGLVEQSGVLDDATALLELRRVRFHRMVAPGTSLRVRLAAGAETTTASGKLLREYAWTALDGAGEVLAEAEVLMLMGRQEGGDG